MARHQRTSKVSVPILLAVALGVGIGAVAMYDLWRELDTLGQRDVHYQAVLAAHGSGDDDAVIRRAKAYLASRPRNPSNAREEHVLSLYGEALGRWVAYNLRNEAVSIDDEIAAFQDSFAVVNGVSR